MRNYGLKLSLESFWGRMQTEFLKRTSWTTVVDLSMAMADYIENFHKIRSRDQSLDMLTQHEYETTNLS